MGRIADSLADQLVVTNDNPRSESPEMIAEDILVGITVQPARRTRSRRRYSHAV